MYAQRFEECGRCRRTVVAITQTRVPSLDPRALCLRRRQHRSPTVSGVQGDASHRLEGETSPPSRDTSTDSHECRRQPSTSQEITASSVPRGIQGYTARIQPDTCRYPSEQRVQAVRVMATPVQVGRILYRGGATMKSSAGRVRPRRPHGPGTCPMYPARIPIPCRTPAR